MADRKKFFVVPWGEKSWQVKANGRIVSNHRNKANAIASARKRAVKAGLAQVLVQKRNGKFQIEFTYKKDPRKTKG